MIDLEFQNKIDKMSKSEIDRLNSLKLINEQKHNKDREIKEIKQKQIAEE